MNDLAELRLGQEDSSIRFELYRTGSRLQVDLAESLTVIEL